MGAQSESLHVRLLPSWYQDMHANPATSIIQWARIAHRHNPTKAPYLVSQGRDWTLNKKTWLRGTKWLILLRLLGPIISSIQVALDSSNYPSWRCTEESFLRKRWTMQLIPWHSLLSFGLLGIGLRGLSIVCQSPSSGIDRSKELAWTLPASLMVNKSPTSSPMPSSWPCLLVWFGLYQFQNNKNFSFPEFSLSVACKFSIYRSYRGELVIWLCLELWYSTAFDYGAW